MNDEGSRRNGLLIILCLVIFSLWSTSHSQKITISELRATIENCSSTIDEANYNIEDINSRMLDAQYMAWEDYYSMGDALENLYEGDTVSNDCYDSTE